MNIDGTNPERLYGQVNYDGQANACNQTRHSWYFVWDPTGNFVYVSLQYAGQPGAIIIKVGVTPMDDPKPAEVFLFNNVDVNSPEFTIDPNGEYFVFEDSRTRYFRKGETTNNQTLYREWYLQNRWYPIYDIRQPNSSTTLNGTSTTPSRLAALPTFSSEGKYLLYITEYSTYTDVNLLEISSGMLKRVTTTDGSCRVYYADFSPDNTKIIFSTDCNSTGTGFATSNTYKFKTIDITNYDDFDNIGFSIDWGYNDIVTSINHTFDYGNAADFSPTVSIVTNDIDDKVKNSDIVRVTTTFSEAMSASPTISIDLPNGTDIGPESMTQSTTADVWYYDWSVDNGLSSGTATITLAGSDTTGNDIEGSKSYTVEIDNTDPTLAITTSDSSLIIGDTPTITFTFSEDVLGFTEGDITLTGGGTLASITATSSQVYTATYTPPTDTTGTVTITVGTST